MTQNAQTKDLSNDPVWQCIRHEAKRNAEGEPILASFLHATVLNHSTLEAALSFHLSSLIGCSTAPALALRELIDDALANDPSIGEATRYDLQAIKDRDSSCSECCTPFLYFKGFHALQIWRISHWLWQQNRRELALFLQSRVCLTFGIDIHPAANIGKGIMLDHASGIVIGETATVGDDVSIMQGVTLGGTGKTSGDRHPKIGRNVLIGAGAKIIGNIHIGEGVHIFSGSVVIKDVPEHVAVAGVPAEIVGKPCDRPATAMKQTLD